MHISTLTRTASALLGATATATATAATTMLPAGDSGVQCTRPGWSCQSPGITAFCNRKLKHTGGYVCSKSSCCSVDSAGMASCSVKACDKYPADAGLEAASMPPLPGWEWPRPPRSRPTPATTPGPHAKRTVEPRGRPPMHPWAHKPHDPCPHVGACKVACFLRDGRAVPWLCTGDGEGATWELVSDLVRARRPGRCDAVLARQEREPLRCRQDHAVMRPALAPRLPPPPPPPARARLTTDCTISQMRCHETGMQVCNGDHVWVTLHDCAASGETCAMDASNSPACKPSPVEEL